MPYDANSDLPRTVRNALPGRARTIWRDAYNAGHGKGYDESRAARYAWGAVKNAGFRKGKGGEWVHGES